jgi:hypothetical protein
MPAAAAKPKSSLPPSVYTATPNCQYMQNHRPVQPFGAQSAMAAGMTSEGQPLLFSFDSAGNFQATVAADGNSVQWTTYPIGVSSYAAGQASPAMFGASQQGNQGQQSGAISLVMAMTVNPGDGGSFATGSYHEVWLLPNLSNDPQAPWLSAKSQPWLKLNFPDNPALGLSAAKLQLADLRVLTLSTTGPNGTPSTALAHVVDPTNGNLLSFYIDMTNTSGDGAWTLLNPECSFTALTDSATGALDSSNAVGLYKLYEYQGTNCLTFMSSQDPVTKFPVSSAASAIASLPGVYEGNSVTDLFVSDGPNINLFLSSGSATAPVPITIMSASWLAGCTSLHATVDLSDTPNAVVSLWGVTASKAAFHVQAPYANRSVPTAWNVPFPLLGQVNSAAVHIGTTRGLTAIFANQGPAGATNLVELHKDHLTLSGANHWRKKPVHVAPAPGASGQSLFQTLQTYTHRIQFLDQNGVPPPAVTSGTAVVGAAVTISTSATVVLEINGLITTVNAGQSVQANLNPSGIVDIMQEAYTPQQPTITVALASQPTATTTIEPALNVRNKITSDVASAAAQQAANSQYNPTTTLPWYNPQNGATLSAVSKTVSQANAINFNATNKPAPTTAKVGDSGLFSFLGDICQAIFEGLEDVFEATVSAVEEGWQLVVKLASDTFNVLIQTVEDIAGAIMSVISWIGATLEDIWNFLAFIFSWDNIFIIQTQLYGFYSGLLGVMGEVIDDILTLLGTWVSANGTALISHAASNAPAQSAQTTSQQGNAKQSANAPQGSPQSTDPRMSWGQSQLPSSGSGPQASQAQPGAKKAASTAPAVAPPKSTDPVIAALQQFLTDFETLAENAVGDLGSLLTGGNVSDAAQTLEANIGQLIVDIGNIITALGQETGASISGLASLIDGSSGIPSFFSGVYDVFAPAGSPPFGFLSIFCLLQAVPTAIAYDIACGGKADVNNFLPASVTTQFCTQLTTYLKNLTAPAPIATKAPASKPATVTLAVSAPVAPKAAVAKPAAPAGQTVLVAKAVSDDTWPITTGLFQIVHGGLRILRGVSTNASYLAEIAYMQQNINPTSIAFRAALVEDGLIWAGEGLTGLGIDLVEGNSPWINIVNLVGGLCVAVRAYLVPFGADTFNTLASVSNFMALTSIGVGVFELIDGIEDLDDSSAAVVVAGASDACYGANEVLEIFTAVGAEMIKHNPEEYDEPDFITTITSANELRCTLMIVAGIGEMVAAILGWVEAGSQATKKLA